MNLFVAFLGALASAAVGYGVTKLFDYLFKIFKEKRWVSFAVAGVFALGFISAYLASPYFRDVLKAWLDASPTERQCFFEARIDNPNGADAQSGAHGFITAPNTPISWSPTNCMLVIQAYQNTVLLDQVKNRRPGEAMVQDINRGRSGEIELKIFQDGFETASHYVWLEVSP